MLNRWVVRQEYFGKFDLTTIICSTDSINNAALVIDGLCHDFTEYVEGVNCLEYGEGACYHG